MLGDPLICDDAFVQEHWQKVWNVSTVAEDATFSIVMMDQMYPYAEMPDVSCDFVGDQVPREAKSRCCSAPVFRDGDYLICNQCRLVTKPVEVRGD